MSNTEKMVSVPREQLEKIREWIESARDGVLYPIARDFDGVVGRNAEGLGQETPALMEGIDELLAKPVEQRQSDPVAWVYMLNGKVNYDTDIVISNSAGDTLGDGDSWEPVYTRADPDEAEWSAMQQRLGDQNESLRAQLAERDALLREASAAIKQGYIDFDAVYAACRNWDELVRDGIASKVALKIDSVLSDSADPIPDHSVEENKKVERDEPKSCDEANQENAPTFMGEPNPHHPIEWYREGIHKHWKTICNQRQKIDVLSSALKFYADRDHYYFESDNWDTVSGEPLNILWHIEEPDFVEDGQIARSALEKSYE